MTEYNYEIELSILNSNLDDITKIKLIQQQAINRKNEALLNFQNTFNPMNFMMPQMLKPNLSKDPNEVTMSNNNSTEIFGSGSVFRPGNDLMAQNLSKQV